MTVLCAEAEEEEDGLCFSIPHFAAAAKDGLIQPVRKKHSHSSCLFNRVGYCCCLPSPSLTGKNPWEPIGAQQLQQGARVSDSSGNVPGLLELRYSCQCKRRVPKSHQHLINPER